MRFLVVSPVLLVGLILGCDPLVERPLVPEVGVAIVDPVEGAAFDQPGPLLAVEVQVAGCDQVQSLSLYARSTELDTEAEPAGSPGRYRFAAPVLALYEQFLYGPARDWDLFLQARLVCADFGQEAVSDWCGITLSPFGYLEGTRSPIYQLVVLEGDPRIVALSEDALNILGPDGEFASLAQPSSQSLVGQIGQDLYLWADCTDVVCWNRSGTIYHLRLEGDGLSIYALQQLDLMNDPIALVESPDPGQLLAIGEGGGFGAVLTYCDLALSNPIEVALASEPVAPVRKLPDGRVRFLGFPALGGSSNLQVVDVLPGQTVVTLPLSLSLTPAESLWTVSEDGSRAAILHRDTGQLHRFTLADGASLPQLIVGDDGDDRWLSLDFGSNEELLLVTDASARSLEFASGHQRWRVESPSWIEAVVAIDGQGIGLLTQDLDLWLVDPQGLVTHQFGPLPSSWRVTSNLLSIPGWVLVGLEDQLAGYRLTN